jgi:tetratricopeptide (TPR) repeat protein
VLGNSRRNHAHPLNAWQPSASVYHRHVDPNDPVVRLCAQGMEYEGSGRLEEAAQLFLSAWNQSTDDFERCIAAHYVARHQKNPAESLMWNQRSLDFANAAADDRVREFYPSLYLNMGKAHEDAGNHEAAARFYEMAASAVDCLPEGPYGKFVRDAIAKAQHRLAEC